MQWLRVQKVKGQGHTVTKTVTVARFLVARAVVHASADEDLMFVCLLCNEEEMEKK